jgi:hypothetical protein
VSFETDIDMDDADPFLNPDFAQEPDLPPEPPTTATLAPNGQCVSSINVGKNHYWCETGQEGHAGLCSGSDPWGGRAEWRWWLER